MKTNFKTILFLLISSFVMFFMGACEDPDVNIEGDGNDSIIDTLPKDTIKEDTVIVLPFDSTNQVSLQYCYDTIATALGQDYTSTVYEQSAAIKFSTKQLHPFRGNYLFKVLIGLHGNDRKGKTTEFSDLRVWVRDNLSGKDLYSQSISDSIKLSSWNEVMFEVPYLLPIKAKDLYVGYTIKANGLVIGCDGTPKEYVNNDGSYIYDCATSKWLTYKDMGNLTIKAIVVGANLPKFDVELTGVRTAQYVKPGVKFDAIASVKNISNNQVQSFEFVILNEGKEIMRQPITLDKPLSKEEKMVFFVQDLVMPQEGEYAVTYKVDKVNGGKDFNESNNKIVYNTIVSNKLIDRTVLLENTTGDMCGACPTGHKYLEQALSKVGADKFIWVAHHAGYNQGKYTSVQSDTVARLFYGASMTYAPGLMIERTNLLNAGMVSNDGADGPIFMLNEAGETNKLPVILNIMQKNYSPVKLDVQNIYNDATRELTVKVTGEVIADLVEGQNLDLGIILLEDNLLGTQAGAGVGQYIHNHVCRDGLTSILGNKINVTNGKFEYTYKKVLSEKFAIGNVSVVAWVANRPSNKFDQNGHQVYQAVQAKIK